MLPAVRSVRRRWRTDLEVTTDTTPTDGHVRAVRSEWLTRYAKSA